MNLDLTPEFLEAFESGVKHQAEGRPAEAEAAWDRAARLSPEGWFGLGSQGILAKDWLGARAIFERILSLPVGSFLHGLAMNNMGMIEGHTGDRRSAARWFRAAAELVPRNPEVILNLGLVASWEGKPEQAIEFCRLAARSKANFHGALFQLSIALLAAGKYAEGWPYYEYRWQEAQLAWTRVSLPGVPEWAGEDLRGKRLMVCGEQGSGDLIFAARCFPLLRRLGAKLIGNFPDGFRELMMSTHQFDWVYQPGDAIEEGCVDFTASIMSLFRWLNISTENIPTPAIFRGPAEELPGPRPKIGIAWTGSPKHELDLYRSVGLSRWFPLLENRDVTWFSLQCGPASKEIPIEGPRITDLSRGIRTWTDTARIIRGLDLVISVDTAVVHLAASLGKPVWMLTPRIPDWRWGHSRNVTPWYPSLRLFRAENDLEWEPVIERISEELAALARGEVRALAVA